MTYARTTHEWQHIRWAASLLAIAGCAAEVERLSASDDEAVLDHVEALGFEREQAAIQGDIVLVDGDMIFDRDGLLNGQYERSRLAGGLVEKGYREAEIIAEGRQGNIKLAFATGERAPTKALRDGFIAAAKAWSSIPNSAIRIATTNTGPAVTISMIPAAKWRAESPCASVEACARVPKDGRPGRDLYIRSRPSAGDCGSWGGSNLINVTRHELGHTLGFAHPEGPNSSIVKGTRYCPYDAEEHCEDEDDLGYSTIMGVATVAAGCVVTPARLTQDDYATCRTLYPSR